MCIYNNTQIGHQTSFHSCSYLEYDFKNTLIIFFCLNKHRAWYFLSTVISIGHVCLIPGSLSWYKVGSGGAAAASAGSVLFSSSFPLLGH